MPLFAFDFHLTCVDGCTIQEAAESASHIATLLNVRVCFDFNDIHLMVIPNQKPQATIDLYHALLELKVKAKTQTK